MAVNQLLHNNETLPQEDASSSDVGHGNTTNNNDEHARRVGGWTTLALSARRFQHVLLNMAVDTTTRIHSTYLVLHRTKGIS